eukprot:TRINITY_DN15009_c0_g1_i1.p1 TRINITY_DN15009_c0_g1~~TRINITY_DN15009_c0_g1_i1.p1  ORF type:complete len:1492 (-),score=427.74 TRINITY_DN15009_c0_g1_i1:101-4576(-)
MHVVFFFFFKQKTAYEMLRSLVGSEMCIRDSPEIATMEGGGRRMSWIGMPSPRDGSAQNYRGATLRQSWAAEPEEARMNSIRGMYTLVDDGRGQFRSTQVCYWLGMLDILHSESRIRSTMMEAGAHWHEGDRDGTTGFCQGDFNCFVDMVSETVVREIVQLIDGARRLKEVFALFDLDGSGSISINELTLTLSTQFRRRPTQLEMRELIQSVDIDGSGNINFKEFCMLMLLKHTKKSVQRTLHSIRQPIEDIHLLFRTFCVDQAVSSESRRWCLDEFSKVMLCLGHPYSSADLRRLMRSFRPDESGNVDFPQFALTICNSKQCPEQLEVRGHVRLMEKLFEHFDTKDKGKIPDSELLHVIRRLGGDPSDQEFEQVLAAIAPDRQGDVGFNGLIELISGTATVTQRRIKRRIAEFREAYGLFDVKGTGEVELREFMLGMRLFGEAMAQHGAKLLEAMDADESGGIDFVEFLAMMIQSDTEWPCALRSHLISFRELFNALDLERCGVVTVQDFVEILNDLHMPVPEEVLVAEISAAFNLEEGAGCDGLNFGQFVHLFASIRNSSSQPILCRINELREAFAMVDVDGSGELDLDEIWEALTRLGTSRARSEVAAMVEAMDDNGNGELDFVEFLKMVSEDAGHFNLLGLGEDTSLSEQLCEERGPARGPTAFFNDGTPHGILLSILRETRPRSEARRLGLDRLVSTMRERLFINHVDGFREGQERVAREIAWEMDLAEFGSGTVVAAQGKPLNDMYIVLQGTLDGWASVDDKMHKKRKGQNALWLMLRPACLTLEGDFRKFERALPSQSSLAQGSDGKVWSFLQQHGSMRQMLHAWRASAAQQCDSDMTDVRLVDDLRRGAKELTAAMVEHAAACDALRGCFVLQRANLLGFGETAPSHLEYNERAILETRDLLSAIQRFLGVFQLAFDPKNAVDTARQSVPESAIHNPDDPSIHAKVHDAEFGAHIATLVPGDYFGSRAAATSQQVWDITLTSRRNPLMDNHQQEARGRRSPSPNAWTSATSGMAQNEEGLCSVYCARIRRSAMLDARVVEPLEILKSLKACHGMPRTEMRRLASQMQLVTVTRQERLVSRGQPASKVYIIKDGEVKIQYDLEQMQRAGKKILTTLGEAHEELHQLSQVSDSGTTSHEFRRARKDSLRAEIRLLNTRLGVLKRVGAFTETWHDPHAIARKGKFAQTRVPKLLQSTSIAIMGRLDIIHECDYDDEGREVWLADYTAESATAEVYALDRGLFLKNSWIRHNMVALNDARSEARHSRVQEATKLYTRADISRLITPTTSSKRRLAKRLAKAAGKPSSVRSTPALLPRDSPPDRRPSRSGEAESRRWTPGTLTPGLEQRYTPAPERSLPSQHALKALKHDDNGEAADPEGSPPALAEADFVLKTTDPGSTPEDSLHQTGVHVFHGETSNYVFEETTADMDESDAEVGIIISRAISRGDEVYNPGYCLLYTSDAADEEDSVDLGGRRIIKKKKKKRKSN